MKIFLSWSGNASHQVALTLRDWLPSVIQVVEPYVSSEDIDKGARWSTDISKELEDSAFGILCVTKENINAPWLQFEAGALSKKLDKSFVSPFLFDIKRSEIKGPILQFQSTIIDKADILKLVNTINKACGEEKLKDDRLEKAFDVWYPKLEENLNSIVKPTESPKEEVKRENNLEILEEILELSRSNQRILTTPDSILPIDYLNYAFSKTDKLSNEKSSEFAHRILMHLEDLQMTNLKIKDLTTLYINEGKVPDEEFQILVLRQEENIEYLKSITRRNRRKISI
ncbi:TIR domain-containing protein [uncultured Chryseobacterium sp.]|uniref:TIR domain-containing protein n=1 Tax=uncultured Chryseobacterium sp. TaxID=259322 RepID=UPI00258D945E|nr:TIR domain-containing protein [uncultured Chryseobacterium sp.]